MGRQPDLGGLRSSFHRQDVAALVGVARGDHGAGRHLVSGPRGVRRHGDDRLWLRQRHPGHPGGEPADPADRAADQLLRGARRRRYRPAHARRRVRLHRLDHHVADLRLVHLHLLRHRGGHSGGDAGDLLRHSAAARLRAVLGHGGAAGDPRHHLHQPSPALVAAVVGRPAASAVHRPGFERLGCVPELGILQGHGARRGWRVPSRAVRGRGVGGVLADRAGGRTGRLPAFPAGPHTCWLEGGSLECRLVGGDAGGWARLDRDRGAEAAGRVVPGVPGGVRGCGADARPAAEHDVRGRLQARGPIADRVARAGVVPSRGLPQHRNRTVADVVHLAAV